MKSCIYRAAVMLACLAATANSAPGAMKEDPPVVQFFYELLAKASTSTEVITINLTTMATIIALKILIFLLGTFGYTIIEQQQQGSGSGDNIFRDRSDFFYSSNYNNNNNNSSNNNNNKQNELAGAMCFMMYTAGDHEKHSCIERMACEDRITAANYLLAAKMWLDIHKMMPAVPFNEVGYRSIMWDVEKAIEDSGKGGDCSKYRW